MRCRQGQAREENGLTLSHRTFAIFTPLKIFEKAREEMCQKW